MRVPQLRQALDTLENELRFVFITSYADVHDAKGRPEDTVTSEVEGLFPEGTAVAA